MPKFLKAVMAALATTFVSKRPIPYETRVWDGSNCFMHYSESFSEALAWASCYGHEFGGIATVWQGGAFVAAREYN